VGLQFSRAVEDTEIWNANGDGFSFVISSENSTSLGFHGKTGFSGNLVLNRYYDPRCPGLIC
jgi:hypothetical protein